MKKKQWIWLILAILIFAGAGTLSVVSNAWSKTQIANSVSALSELYSGFGGGSETAAFPEEPFIAKLDIEGTIADSDSAAGFVAGGFDEAYILDYIDRLTACPDNAGILLFVNSGGGSVKASDEVYLKLMDYKAATGRPVYAYFDGVACSGAYYVAMAADEIWANRNCVCVNIGVYISTYNLSELFDNYGIEEILIKSSDNKAIGSIGQEWTDEQLEIYQSIVDIYYNQFVEIVAEGRGMTAEQVKKKDDGREMLAPQALEAGFIDGIGRYEEYRDQVLGYQDGVSLYEEPLPEMDMLSQLLRNIYGSVKSLVPRSDLEILRDFAQQQDRIVVMAYAG